MSVKNCFGERGAKVSVNRFSGLFRNFLAMTVTTMESTVLKCILYMLCC